MVEVQLVIILKMLMGDSCDMDHGEIGSRCFESRTTSAVRLKAENTDNS